MQLIDTHTHLDFPVFDADRAPLLARSRALGVERMVVLGSGSRLEVSDLPATVRAAGTAGAGTGRGLRDAERQLIAEALRRHRDNRTKAAQELGISRRTLHRKLNEFGLRTTRDE